MSTKCSKCINKDYPKTHVPCLSCVDNPTTHPTESAFQIAPKPSCYTCTHSTDEGRPTKNISCINCIRSPHKPVDNYQLYISCDTCANLTRTKSGIKRTEACKNCYRASNNATLNNWTPREAPQ